MSSVDLPMPGSPPTSSTEPRTKPPPVTRSNSAMPEASRGASWLLPVRVSSVNSRPLRRLRIETGMLVAPVVSSSASVFHYSPQDFTCPASGYRRRRSSGRQKERVDLAMDRRNRCAGDGQPLHSTKSLKVPILFSGPSPIPQGRPQGRPQGSPQVVPAFPVRDPVLSEHFIGAGDQGRRRTHGRAPWRSPN